MLSRCAAADRLLYSCGCACADASRFDAVSPGSADITNEDDEMGKVTVPLHRGGDELRDLAVKGAADFDDFTMGLKYTCRMGDVAAAAGDLVSEI